MPCLDTARGRRGATWEALMRFEYMERYNSTYIGKRALWYLFRFETNNMWFWREDQ